jgi:hypothetical protein
MLNDCFSKMTNKRIAAAGAVVIVRGGSVVSHCHSEFNGGGRVLSR